MSAVFWAQIKDLTRRVEALEAATKQEPFVPTPELTAAHEMAKTEFVSNIVKRGPGRPKKA